MLERTKAPPIEVFQVICPVATYPVLSAFIVQNGGKIERTVQAEEVLDMRPGTILRGARYREELTQAELAQKTGISPRHISDMENHRRPIGKKNAHLFAEAMNTGYKVFL